MKNTEILLFLLIALFSCKPNNSIEIHQKPVEIDAENPFYYLPRILDMFGDTIIFLNNESNAVSTIIASSGKYWNSITTEDLPIEELYSTLKQHNPNAYNYEDAKHHTNFTTGVKFKTAKVNQETGKAYSILSMSYPEDNNYEVEGEMTLARFWISVYFLLELDLAHEKIEAFYYFDENGIPETSGFNLQSPIAFDNNAIHIGLNTLMNADTIYREVVFYRTDEGTLKVQNLITENTPSTKNTIHNGSIHQGDVWPVFGTEKRIRNGIVEEDGKLLRQSHFGEINNHSCYLGGDIYGRFPNWKDSVSIMIDNKPLLTSGIKEISGLCYSNQGMYFFTRGEKEASIFINKIKL